MFADKDVTTASSLKSPHENQKEKCQESPRQTVGAEPNAAKLTLGARSPLGNMGAAAGLGPSAQSRGPTEKWDQPYFGNQPYFEDGEEILNGEEAPWGEININAILSLSLSLTALLRTRKALCRPRASLGHSLA